MQRYQGGLHPVRREIGPLHGVLLVAIGALVLGVGCAPSFHAPPHLIATWPTQGATLSLARHTLELTFNRSLEPASISVRVTRQEDGASLPVDTQFDPSDGHHVQVRVLDPAPGSYVLHWRAAAEAADSGEGDYTFNLRPDAPAPPRLDVSPALADLGDVLEIVGKGFEPSAAVQLLIGDDGQQLADVKSDAHGRINVQARLPETVPYGVQPLRAADASGHVGAASVHVRWGGWPPLVAMDVGQPGPDHGQVTFEVSMLNRSDFLLEDVRLTLVHPDAATFLDAEPAPERSDGNLSWRVSVMDRGRVGPFRATFATREPLVSHVSMTYRHRHSLGCARDGCMPAFMSNSAAESAATAPLD